MNNEAARSPTGEILDQQTPTEVKPTDSTQTDSTTKVDPSLSTEKPADGTTVLTKPETKPDDKKPDAPTGAPDKYADFKAPDNYTLDPKAIEAAVPIFKELGLTQDAAQKLVDFHANQMLAATKGPQDAYAATRADWQAKVTADPDMKAATSGGKTGLDAVKLDIGRALNAIGDESLVKDFKVAMDITGAGDHPAFVKAMWKLAQFIGEGKHVTGAGPSEHGQTKPGAKPPTIANALYPNLPG